MAYTQLALFGTRPARMNFGLNGKTALVNGAIADSALRVDGGVVRAVL